MIQRSVELDAPAVRVWAAARSPEAFRYVTRGLVRLTGLPRTGRFAQGARIEGWLLLGEAIPLHRHHLEVVRVDETAMTLSSHEWGGLLRRWDHDIVVERLDDQRCRYTDRVLIDAGPFTMPVAVFACRQFDNAVHLAAHVQRCHPSPGQDYYLRRIAEGKTKKEAMRCLERQVAKVIYRIRTGRQIQGRRPRSARRRVRPVRITSGTSSRNPRRTA